MTTQCVYNDQKKACQAYAILDSKYCFFHDPANAKKRAEARKKGGFNRRIIKNTEHNYQSIKTVNDINIILESAINRASTLECSQSQLRTLGYLCQIALKGQELGSLEDRIDILEKRISEIQK